MGEVILRSMLGSAGLGDQVVVDSAGTGGWHEGDSADPRTVRALKEHGYDGTHHRAREFRPEWFSHRDLIVVESACRGIAAHLDAELAQRSEPANRPT